MNNQLAHAIFLISEYLTGAHTNVWLKTLEPMQWWNASQMQHWQEQELTRILRWATETTPYYQRIASPLNRDDFSDVREYLRQFPILTKDMLRANFNEIQTTAPSKRKPYVNSTSGSTGKPLRLMVNFEAIGRYFAGKRRALAWYGVRFADRQIRIWGFPLKRSQQVIWRVRDIFQNRLRLKSFDLSTDALSDFYDKAVKFQPVYINGYTSAVYRFANFIETTGRDGRALGLKVVVPTAEILYEWQREEIERAFGCPVMNEYGGGEGQGIAYECQHRRLHITHENYFCEVLDEQGKPVLPGEPGLLTFTSFCNTAMPLIRYQNGDVVVEELNVHCECGRHQGLPAFSQIVGRSADVLLRGDGEQTHWTTIYYAIKEEFTPEMVTEHQARQKAVDFIELLIVKGPKYDDAAMARFLNRIKSVLGQNVQIETKFVTEIPREKSGKLRYFVSDIKHAQQRSQPVP